MSFEREQAVGSRDVHWISARKEFDGLWSPGRIWNMRSHLLMPAAESQPNMAGFVAEEPAHTLQEKPESNPSEEDRETYVVPYCLDVQPPVTRNFSLLGTITQLYYTGWW